MARILNVSDNNYRIVVQNTGTITLDTGVAVGEVRITGNLIVDGEYTTVNVTNMTVEDNIIVLNSGELGAGITEGTSGLTLDRGTLPNAEFLFDESVDHYDPYTSADISGTFVLRTDNGNKSGLQLSTIVRDGAHNIYFDLQDSTINVLEIVNVDPEIYSDLLIDADPLNPDPATLNYVPNKQFIKNYIQSGVVTPGMADVDKIYKSSGGLLKSRIQAYTTDIRFYIDETLRSVITSTGLSVDNINLYTDSITNTSNNLRLTATNNNVEVDAVLNLDDQLSDPIFTSGKTKVYSRSQLTALAQTPGRTGIFFANTITSDELVAKNRALLFSMLF